MEFSFSKKEKLKGRKLIEKLFSEGNSLTVFPLKLFYITHTNKTKTGVSVSKKFFKKAVDRNRIKRLMREAYRLNKNLLIDNNIDGYALMILYISKEMPDFKEINNKTKLLISKFIKTIS